MTSRRGGSNWPGRRTPRSARRSTGSADFRARHAAEAPAALERLRTVAAQGGNVFDALMDAVRHCTLGQLSEAFFEVGGQYRRNL